MFVIRLSPGARPKLFPVRNVKAETRLETLREWKETGGVLIVGYEMLRKFFAAPKKVSSFIVILSLGSGECRQENETSWTCDDISFFLAF